MGTNQLGGIFQGRSTQTILKAQLHLLDPKMKSNETIYLYAGNEKETHRKASEKDTNMY